MHGSRRERTDDLLRSFSIFPDLLHWEEPMKFIHTADIHWGMIPDSDKPWGKKREQAIRLTFQGIIEDARDSRADLLLISGDLFHRQPLARDLK